MIRLALGGGQNVLERGFEQGKSGGQKNGLETVTAGQVASDKGLY